ncbi:hypothetical protein RISK_000898 [Rhodopirellula islandica]|uniref:Uncharacterized protein n=1 Tax=Rhodopirellula islandica TaxID=595434 RepID=A0A0J1BKR9_RHOIS|nr:hypothetical protein RISK_000898 [Rhodopirellula islandica]
MGLYAFHPIGSSLGLAFNDWFDRVGSLHAKRWNHVWIQRLLSGGGGWGVGIPICRKVLS